MSSSSYVILEYEFKVNGKIPSDLLSSFEDKFIKFFYYFCDHILFDINFYFPNKEIYNAYWPNIHSELTEIKEIDKNLFKVKLWFAYDETLSKRGKKKLIEHCKEFIRRMNKFFELFGYDVRFGDEPISEEVYDPVEEYGIVPDYEDLFLDDEDDEDS
ncbi:hypothetical protein [Caldicellulosiruptor naganoensis]|uniref:Uncharacterized protein n=1 Tax=Caldicellulosiruptor naganoensis TaxID=29324 RepID=A0ABY7BFQ2_9FIRM|nr:hypothetical protein [Caldicellulosiruptor naganoensis]WAM31647.1 hypothetical protein OTJ99_000077 [Caldicellulosiruptor naganoensis]